MPDPTHAPRPRRRHYDAFISYSRSAEGEFVPRMQSMLRGFGRGAGGTSDDRDLRLFVDRTGLAAHPHLWLEIKNCLEASENLIVVASPGAAASEWVDKEIRWWLAERSIHTVYIALTSGEIVFDHDAGRIDTRATTALPPALIEQLDREPRWVDLRGPRRTPERRDDPVLAVALAELGEPLRRADKEDVLAAHISAQRGRNRRTRALASALSVLLAISVFNGAAASWSAEQEAAASYASDAHLLAAASHATRAEDPDRAKYLAAEAYFRAPSTQTRHAFLTAVLDSPHDDQHLLRTVDTPGVTALVPTDDGVVGRTATGGLLRWNPADGDPEVLPGGRARIPVPDAVAGSVTVSGSTDRSVVAAVDDAGIVLGRFPGPDASPADDGDLVRLYDLEPTAVAVTPTGDALVVVHHLDRTCRDGHDHQLLRIALTGPAGDLPLSDVGTRVRKFLGSPRAACVLDDGPGAGVRAVTTGVAATALDISNGGTIRLADTRTRDTGLLNVDTLLEPVPESPARAAPPGTVAASSLATWVELSGSDATTQVVRHHPFAADDAAGPMPCPVPATWSRPRTVAFDDAASRALIRTEDGLVACSAHGDPLWPEISTWHLPGAASSTLAVLAPGDRVIAADGERLSVWSTEPDNSDLALPPGVADRPGATPVVAARPGDRLPSHAATTALSWPDGTVQVHQKGAVRVPGAPGDEPLLPVWLTSPAAERGTPSSPTGDLLLLAPDGRAWIADTDEMPDPAEPLPGFRDLLLRAHATHPDRRLEPGCLPVRAAAPDDCPTLVAAHRTPDRLVLVDSAGGVYLLDPRLSSAPRYVPDELGLAAPIASPWDEPGRVAVDDDGRWVAVAPRGRALRVLDLAAGSLEWRVRGSTMAQVHIVDQVRGDGAGGGIPSDDGAGLVALAGDGSVRTGSLAGHGPLRLLLPGGTRDDLLAVLAEPGLVVRNEGTRLALYDIHSGRRLGSIATSLRAAHGRPAPGTVHAAHGRLLMVQDHGTTISHALDKDEDTMLAETCRSAAPALTPEDLALLGVRHTPTRCRIVHSHDLPTLTDPDLLVPHRGFPPS